MQITVYCLGNNDEKRRMHLLCIDTFFKKNIFNLQLGELLDGEPTGMIDQFQDKDIPWKEA